MRRNKPIAEVLAQANRKSASIHNELIKELDNRERVFKSPSTSRIVLAINRLIDSLGRYSNSSSQRSNRTLVALRNYDTAMSSCADVYRRLLRAIDGNPIEILAHGKYGTTSDDDFIQAFYDAISDNSVRRWTRKHLEMIKAAVSERESIRRKIGKLDKMANGTTPEGRTAAAKKKVFQDTANALSFRIASVVRKFLQLRNLALKTLVGATESIYVALGDEIPREIVARYNTEVITAELSDADRKATDRRRA